MSYSNMWNPDPPSPEERLESQIKAAGGVIVRTMSDVPATEHGAILRYEIFRMIPVTYVAYADRALWLTEVKRLAVEGVPFTAFLASPVSAKVSVDVSVEQNRGL